MSDTLSRLKQIKRKHDDYNRLVTLLLSAVVCLIGALLWLNEVPLLDEYKPITGVLIMLLAAVFYKTPHFSYLLNRRYFSDDAEMSQLMGADWNTYKDRILNVTSAVNADNSK